ncbi:MAG TPA: YidC/Oxa1 family membrane protein insertase [Limnochordales bacterium]|nr:YidC/Oxa1 family membrane protein insertase [Limnochordales bacterium]
MIEFFQNILLQLLVFFADLTNSSGLAIILLTVTIRLALYPLTLSQTKSLAAMRELQPKIQELQKKYKDKPQEYQKRVMELYQEHKINPLGGCLPVLIQLPFLWALFRVLQDFPLEQRDFLIWDLAGPAGEPLWILPILSGLTTYGQMMLTSTDPSQRAMMLIMPLFLTWISIQFPAGLVLYWVVSNLFSMGQQYLINKQLEAAKKGDKAG